VLHDRIRTLSYLCRFRVSAQGIGVVQHFRDNQFFHDKIIKKEYKYDIPANASEQTPDADGITDNMLDFSWDRDVKISVRLRLVVPEVVSNRGKIAGH